MLDSKKIEFSKLILIVVFLTALVFSGLAAYLAVIGADTSSFAPIVLAIWAELSMSSGFYYWKAKNENKIKILSSIPKELLETVKDILRED